MIVGAARGFNAPFGRGARAAKLWFNGGMMTQRTRKLVGAVALLVFLSVYALLAMLAAVVLQVNGSRIAELVYYVVAGLAWVVPAGLLITWMQRPDPAAPGDGGR